MRLSYHHYRPWSLLLMLLVGVLYSAAIVASAPTAVPTPVISPQSGPLASDGVFNMQLSPDSSYVVYLADQSSDRLFELYSVQLPNGSPVKLDDGAVAERALYFFISPDSQYVVYQRSSNSDIYSIPIGGGTPVLLNSMAQSASRLSVLQISPNSQHVLYISTQVGVSQGIYSVPIGGGTPVQLGGPPFTSNSIQLTPDGQYVVWSEVAGDLYSVPIGGGTAVKLNNTLSTGPGIGYFGFALSPDSSRVVFLAEQGNPAGGLYSVPITGTIPIRISGPGSVSVASTDFEISPDSSRVVYRSGGQVFSAPIGGGSTPLTLNGTLVSGGSVRGFVVSLDSSRVLYLADQDISQAVDLYSVPIGGGIAVKLGGPSHASERLFVHLTPDGSRAIYGADEDTPGIVEIYSVPIGGGTALKLNDTLPTGKQVLWFQISPNSDRLVYGTGSGGGAEVAMESLFSAPTSGGSVIALTSSLIGVGSLHSFLFTPDGNYVVYEADQDEDGRDELYALEAEPLLLRAIGQLQKVVYMPMVTTQ